MNWWYLTDCCDRLYTRRILVQHPICKVGRFDALHKVKLTGGESSERDLREGQRSRYGEHDRGTLVWVLGFFKKSALRFITVLSRVRVIFIFTFFWTVVPLGKDIVDFCVTGNADHFSSFYFSCETNQSAVRFAAYTWYLWNRKLNIFPKSRSESV